MTPTRAELETIDWRISLIESCPGRVSINLLGGVYP